MWSGTVCETAIRSDCSEYRTAVRMWRVASHFGADGDGKSLITFPLWVLNEDLLNYCTRLSTSFLAIEEIPLKIWLKRSLAYKPFAGAHISRIIIIRRKILSWIFVFCWTSHQNRRNVKCSHIHLPGYYAVFDADRQGQTVPEINKKAYQTDTYSKNCLCTSSMKV